MLRIGNGVRVFAALSGDSLVYAEMQVCRIPSVNVFFDNFSRVKALVSYPIFSCFGCSGMVYRSFILVIFWFWSYLLIIGFN